jgi:phosphoglycerate dehydrogenase-like enzyme
MEQQELLAHPRLVWTPHIAWYSDHSMEELQKRAAENMIALLTGGETEDELKHPSNI